jgi:ATP:cob(I)alamin adenosyltransferase
MCIFDKVSAPKMKIYTRKGDKGKTSLIGGTRVHKHHMRIEAYGTVDELNSWLGVIRDLTNNDGVRTLLKEVQDRLFTAGSAVAAASIGAVQCASDWVRLRPLEVPVLAALTPV